MNNLRDILINLNCYKKTNDDMYFEWALENIINRLLYRKEELQYEIKDIEKSLELIELIKKESK